MMIKSRSDEKPLKTFRECIGLTQDELAHQLGVSKTMIGYYEAGERLPTLERFIKMAKILKVSLKTLASAMKLDLSGIPDDEPLTR